MLDFPQLFRSRFQPNFGLLDFFGEGSGRNRRLDALGEWMLFRSAQWAGLTGFKRGAVFLQGGHYQGFLIMVPDQCQMLLALLPARASLIRYGVQFLQLRLQGLQAGLMPQNIFPDD